MADKAYWKDRAHCAEDELSEALESLEACRRRLEEMAETGRLERVAHWDTGARLSLSREHCDRLSVAYEAYSERLIEIETALMEWRHRLEQTELGGPVMFRASAADEIARILW